MGQCSNCGHDIADDARFCPHCGTATTPADGGDTTSVIPAVVDEVQVSGDLTAEEEAAIRALPAGSALLLVHKGAGAGARFLLDQDESTAGRHPRSDIFLDDITVSRHHVMFLRVADKMVVRDCGSLNGTYVNRALIDGDVVLQNGDEVRVGKFRLMYFASPHGLGG